MNVEAFVIVVPTRAGLRYFRAIDKHPRTGRPRMRTAYTIGGAAIFTTEQDRIAAMRKIGAAWRKTQSESFAHAHTVRIHCATSGRGALSAIWGANT